MPNGIGRLSVYVTGLVMLTGTPAAVDAEEPSESRQRQIRLLTQQIEANSRELERRRIVLKRLSRELDQHRTHLASENFVVSGPTRELAQAILDEAEAWRDSLAREWLGGPLPPGDNFASIHLELSKTRDVGTTLLCGPTRRFQGAHYIWLTTSRKRALGGTLHHELAHVVLNARFPDRMPAWANEGIASRLDDAGRVAIRKRALETMSRTGRWPDLAGLLNRPTIAPTDQAAYAVSVSLTEYLLSRGTRARFLDFVELGQRTGWNTALRRTYGIAGIDQLGRNWRTWLSQRQSVRPARSIR